MTRVSELSLRRGRSGTSCEDGARKGFAPSAAGAATSTRGAPPVRCGRRPLIRSAARPAGCWVPPRGTGGSRDSGKGVAASSAMPCAVRRAEETSRRLGARAVPRGSVTRQKLSSCFGASVREDDTRRGVRTGSPVRAKSGGARRCLGPRRSQETVHAAWRSRPRLSGSTRGRSGDRGPTPVDTASRCAPLGKPAERRGIRGTPIERRSEKNTLRERSVGSPKRAGSA